MMRLPWTRLSAAVGLAVVMAALLVTLWQGGASAHASAEFSRAVGLYEGMDFRRAPDYDIDVTPLLGVSGDAVMAIAYTQSTDVHGHR